ncbi:MAG: UDP-N-acetylmuramate dehydrogenase [Opitutaceae bacterium]|nr:UDP-N-acetylmuramate dehydrogenase [Opitutaceae bacterium]
MRPASPPTLFGQTVTSLHCVGVCGMGLGPLAIYLAQSGFRVTGQDDQVHPEMLRHLERAGVEMVESGDVPAGCELVVYSSAVRSTHPALQSARQRALPAMRRGEVLAEVTRDLRLVAVCGSHGKTTTTALLITALRASGFPAGYVLGGLLADSRLAPARTGSNDWVVVEVDESDGTIDRFRPALTVVVNLDWDHPDRYREPGDSEAAFRALAARTSGPVLISDACAASQRVLAGPATLRFGPTGDYTADVERTTPEQSWLSLGGRFERRVVPLRAHGDFNVTNATAALAAAGLMGVRVPADALADFPGVQRRQAILVDEPGLVALEDYAHHPAEIRALLGSLRQRLPLHDPERGPGGRLVVAFQPHRFSRTAQFKTSFAAALAVADRVYLLDVYAAGESPQAGGTSADLYAELRHNAPTLPVVYFPGDKAGFHRALQNDLLPDDLLAFVGAGDIEREARQWRSEREQRKRLSQRWDVLAADIRKDVSPATKVVREESLAAKTTLRVGGPARVYCEPANREDLGVVLRRVRQEQVPLIMLGRGSNLLIPDTGVDGVVVSLNHASWHSFDLLSDGRVRVGAGLRLKNLCGLASRAGLAGFEFLEGIPGNVGGALRMNAGAMGGWMFDVVEHVELVTREGEFLTLAKAQMHVDYRHCAELERAIALAAVLKPTAAVPADEPGIRRQIEAYRDKRHKSQPREPSAGCMFKNPPGDSAGRLIDAAGLKGERVGGAEVSAVHANFIVNRGGASSADVVALVRRVRERVRERSGIVLEPEVLLYGRDWKDEL